MFLEGDRGEDRKGGGWKVSQSDKVLIRRELGEVLER